MRKHIPASATLLFLFSLAAASAEYVTVDGRVTFGAQPVCALVLANGSFMFSCDGTGGYSLTAPLDANGQIDLFAFADGFAPFRQTLSPGNLAGVDIGMVLSGDARRLAVSSEVAAAADPDIQGTYELDRFTVIYQNGTYLDSEQTNVSAQGTMTIEGNAYTQLLTVTLNGQQASVAASGTLEDFGFYFRFDDDGSGARFTVPVISRGAKLITQVYNTLSSPNFTEVDQWTKRSRSASATQHSSLHSVVAAGEPGKLAGKAIACIEFGCD